ncbi:MAG: hypothetical protein H6837_09980 [Planctomycetes bacterium]|nr:hypothetical protein [Planctomycetota bacterium]
MPDKTAILVLSDPKSGDEALGRVFNALVAAHEFKSNGDDVTIVFQGAGTRWLGELTKPDHPAHGLFDSVRDKVAGASCACADVFGAADSVRAEGFDLIEGVPLPGMSGGASMRALLREGRQVLTF